jgi:hypothetical protein
VPGPLAHFSSLVALEHLQLWVAEPEASISLAFADVMPDLEELFLIDFVVSDEDLEIREQWERRRASRTPRFVEHDDHTAMLVDLASRWDLEQPRRRTHPARTRRHDTPRAVRPP